MGAFFLLRVQQFFITDLRTRVAGSGRYRSAGSLPGSCWAALPPRAGRPSRLVLGRQPSAVCLVLGGSPASWADCWVGAATPAGSAAGEPRSAAAGACKAPPRGGPGAGTTSCGTRTTGAGTVLGGSPACWADCWVAAAAAAGSAAGEPCPAAAGACGTPPRGSRLLGDCCRWPGQLVVLSDDCPISLFCLKDMAPKGLDFGTFSGL